MSAPSNLFKSQAARYYQNLVRLHSLSLRFAERKLLLALLDLLTLNLALFFLAQQSQSQFTPSPDGIWQRLYWFVVFDALWLVLGSLSGIYDLARAAHPVRSVWAVTNVALLTTGLYLLLPYLSPSLPERRLYIFLFPLSTVAGVALWRAVYARVFVQPVFQQRALVIGAGSQGVALIQAIAAGDDGKGNPYEGIGYAIIGFIDDNPELLGRKIEGIPVLGDRQRLVELVQTLQPDELIVATHSRAIHSELFQAILDCREAGVPVTTMTSLYERVTGRVPVKYADRDLNVVLPVTHSGVHRLYLAGKRLFDIIVAAVGCVFILLLVPFIWLGNRLTAPGDLFYWQERLGEGGRPFMVAKFRSMVMNAEQDTGAIWAMEDDPRITPTGRFLRKTRLDEVPQFWNVFKGEMSLIGPRPERPQFVAQLAEEIPFYRMRHAIKPGLTGWAQVKYRYGASTADSLIKLEYDLYYIKHQSLYLDLQILLKTVQVVLGLKGR